MNEQMKQDRKEFAGQVGVKSERKSRGRRKKQRGIWFGLGMFGLVGWSVAVPALLMLGLGVWIDRTWDSGYSWTLMLLVLGVALGCMNAWYWVKKESESEGEDDIESIDETEPKKAER